MERDKDRETCAVRDNVLLGIAAQRYATAATAVDAGGSAGVLPLNRVALFAAQITRESLDTRGPGRIESHHYHQRTTDHSLSQYYEISLLSFLFLSLSFFLLFFNSPPFVRRSVLFSLIARGLTLTRAEKRGVLFLRKLNEKSG